MSDREKLDYIFAVLESRLRDGKSPLAALEIAIADYSDVFEIKPAAQDKGSGDGTSANSARDETVRANCKWFVSGCEAARYRCCAGVPFTIVRGQHRPLRKRWLLYRPSLSL